MALPNGKVTLLPQAPRSAKPHWLIQAPPHVMTRLKRVFERVSKAEMGSALLAASPENSRELLWFMERFPLVVDTPDLEVMRAQAKAHLEREAKTAQILSFDYEPTGATGMALPARSYQEVAAELAHATGRLLLADDLGLGKTVSAITLLAKACAFPALIVTLTHLPRQWEEEIARFMPGLRVHILRKGTPYELATDQGSLLDGGFGMPDVLISNYHKLPGWAETLAQIPIRTVVFDECQELRRQGDGVNVSQKYAGAAHIARHAEIRLGLSATPVYNYGGEIYNVMDVLAEDALGSRDEFCREWCVGPSDKAKLRDPREFGTYARAEGLMLRRTRADVGRELPALSVFPHEVVTDKKRLSDFTSNLADLARTILSTEDLVKGAKFQAARELNYQLRRETGMAKAPFTAGFVRMLVESGESVVLYGWHHDVYNVWKHALSDFDPAFYTGSESPAQKEREIGRFKRGDTPIAILSLRAGAGLDGLQHCCKTVIFGELDWSPGVHEQAIGRVHRDGQLHPVFAYFLIADSGSDPIIADVLGVKRGQIDGLRDPDAPLVETAVDPNHMRTLAEEYLRQRGELAAVAS